MPAEVALAPLQQWMQAVITAPGDVYDAIASPGAARYVEPGAVGDVVLPSRSLDPLQRVSVYHGMYALRMIEALETDYPVVAHFLGSDAFEELVRAYIEVFPSRSYTLNRLGDDFPRFIASWKGLRHRAFLHDVARLELAMTEVFDERETSPMDPRALESVPPADLADVRFVPIAALRLLASNWDVDGALGAFHDDASIQARRAKRFLVVHRSAYSVLRMRLRRPEFVLLEALVGGATLGDALGRFEASTGRMPAGTQLFGWFRDWTAAGLFASIDWKERT